MVSGLALSSLILDDAIKRYFQNKKKTQNHIFFGWGAKYLSMVASHDCELSAN